MPPKSRRKKSKYTGQRRIQTTPAPQKASVVQPSAEVKEASPTKQPVRPRIAESKAAAPTVSVVSFSNVRRELKNIGILAGVLLVALIILAIVIS